MLIKCRNCNSDYSEYAESCPKCGEKNPNVTDFDWRCLEIDGRKERFSYKTQKDIEKDIEKDSYTLFKICAVTMIILIVVLAFLQ